MSDFLNHNIGTAACLFMAVLMLLFALYFEIGKNEAARHISGFSFYSKEKQNQYDLKSMSRDMRNLFLQLWAIMMIGTLLSALSQFLSIPAFIAWIIRIFMDVHLDDEKAFAKYKLK